VERKGLGLTLAKGKFWGRTEVEKEDYLYYHGSERGGRICTARKRIPILEKRGEKEEGGGRNLNLGGGLQ